MVALRDGRGDAGRNLYAFGLWLVRRACAGSVPAWSWAASCRGGGSCRSSCAPATSPTWGGRSSRRRPRMSRVRRVAPAPDPYATADVDWWIFGRALLGVVAQHRPEAARRHVPDPHDVRRGRRLPLRARGAALERPPAAVLVPALSCSRRGGRRGRPHVTASPRRAPSAGGRWRAVALVTLRCGDVIVGVPLGQLPSPSGSRSGESWPASRREVEAEQELHPVLGPVELHGLRGQGRLPRVPRHRHHMDELGEQRGAAGPCGSTRRSSTATARRWR